MNEQQRAEQVRALMLSDDAASRMLGIAIIEVSPGRAVARMTVRRASELLINEGAQVIMTRTDWDAALDAYYAEHDEVGTDADARGPRFFVVEERGRTWQVTQIVADPAGNHDWALHAWVDLDECDAAGELLVHTTDLSRQD